MAVQQNKKSPSKRGMHRSHNALVQPGTAIEPTTGETHLRHHISPTGFYRGRKIVCAQHGLRRGSGSPTVAARLTASLR
jgi:large subunit ribosomal protein L32